MLWAWCQPKPPRYQILRTIGDDKEFALAGTAVGAVALLTRHDAEWSSRAVPTRAAAGGCGTSNSCHSWQASQWNLLWSAVVQSVLGAKGRKVASRAHRGSCRVAGVSWKCSGATAFSLPFTPCTTFCAEQKVPTTSLFLQRHPERSNIVIMRRRAAPPRAQQLGVLGKGAVLRQTQDCDSEQLVSVSSKTAEHMLLENCWKQDLLCGKLACTASSSL